jgi:Cytochrome P460
MNKSVSRLIVISSLSFLIGIAALATYLLTQPSSIAAARPSSGNSVKEIAGYRDWFKVNQTPQVMQARTALDCAAPAAGNRIYGPANPHHEKYITVYVNEVGRKAMMEQAKPSFPEGSVIVKEKLPDKSSQTPELLTVMIKRGKGFNNDNGDWEYMVADGSGAKVEAQGKLENCQGCHQANRQRDYVFRTYLPYDVKLK